MLPEDFGQYRFLRELGMGGMSSVYLVEDTRLMRRAVMKVLAGDLDSAMQTRFRSEVDAMRQLHHPNIPALFEAGKMADGRPFLVMEWLEGTGLDDVLAERHRMPVADALDVALAVARALGCAHDLGILHLDVKPANVFIPTRGGVPRCGEAKLLDFGVLGKLQRDTGLTTTGSLVGTPNYMSPEQVRAGGLSPAADVFSLGVLLYEVLTGRRPFEEQTVPELLFNVLSQAARPLDPTVPPNVAALVMRCLEKDPHRRPASGNEVAVLIAELQGEGTAAGVAWSAAPAPACMASAPPPPPPPPGRSSRRGVWIGIGLAVAIAAAGALPLARLPWTRWKFILAGAFLCIASVAAGTWVRRLIARKSKQLPGSVSGVLSLAQTRKALSSTLAIQVDEIISKCRLVDDKFLASTMALMVKDYQSARKLDDRQQSLMNAIAILDRLGPKLSPWYVRHESLIATGVSLVGIISGLATATLSITKVVAGGK